MVSFIYSAVVIAVVLFSSIALAFILKKHNLLNFHVLIAIAVSAVIIGIAFPYICGMILGMSSNFPVLAVFLPLIFILAYLTMVFMVTVLVSAVISEQRAKKLIGNIINSRFLNSLKQFGSKFTDTISFKKIQPAIQTNSADISVEESSTNIENNQKIGEEIAGILLEQTAAAEETIDKGKNILEKSVDSEENIDTMCIETIISETINNVEESANNAINIETEEDLNPVESFDIADSYTSSQKMETEEDISSESEQDNISEIEKDLYDIAGQDVAIREDADAEYYIDAAFKLKQQGNYEESVLNYMYALEKQPDKDLVFWIVLDMCVLYKNLGQAELAKDILGSYVSAYGDVMDPEVRNEIEKNL